MDIDLLEQELQDAGELHVVVEEHNHVAQGEDYVGLRSGNTTFDKNANVIYVDDGKKVHLIDAHRVVYASAAKEFPD